MSFSWLTFVQQHGISFRERGESTKRGNIYITCPFCGTADTKGLMGLDLESGRFGCWKDETHRGASPVRLVQALLGCTRKHAQEIVGITQPEPDDWDVLVDKLADKKAKEEKFAWPRETFKLSKDKRSARFLEYLRYERGWREPLEMARAYMLRGARTGDHAWRVLFPLQDQTGAIKGYTGRAIGTARRRYLSTGGEIINKLIFNARGALEGGRVFVGVEGPGDALPLDYYGRKYGVRSGGLLGTAMPPARLGTLAHVTRHFGAFYVVLDHGQEELAQRLCGRLGLLGAQTVPTPKTAAKRKQKDLIQ